MPNATIVIPTYNRAQTLARALRSALSQSYADYDVVVADDCSSDETAEVVRSFDDDRLIYHRQPANVGMIDNHGRGVQLARGDLVAFLADDDEIGPEFLSRRVQALVGRPHARVIFSPYIVRDATGLELWRQGEQAVGDVVLTGAELLQAALTRRWFIGGAVYRRGDLLRIWPRLARDGVAFDFGLNVRLALSERAAGVHVQADDYWMTVHDKQNSRSPEMFDNVTMLLEQVWSELAPRDPRRRSIRRELAYWRTIWGRAVAQEDDLRRARALLASAVRTAPELAWPWTQLASSVIAPAHFIRSCRVPAEARPR